MTLCKDCAYFDDGFVGENCIGDEYCLRPVLSTTYGTKSLCNDPEYERANGECGLAAKYFKDIKPISIKKSLFSRLFGGK